MDEEIKKATIMLHEISGESITKNIEALVLCQPKKKIVTLSVAKDNNIIPIAECHDIDIASLCPYDFAEGIIKVAYPDGDVPMIRVRLMFS